MREALKLETKETKRTPVNDARGSRKVFFSPTQARAPPISRPSSATKRSRCAALRCGEPLCTRFDRAAHGLHGRLPSA